MPTPALSHRERVLLALAHRETDRIPIALVCSGINEPARTLFDRHLRETRGVGVDEYLRPLIDIRGVGPRYIGPPLAPGEDIWGVVRQAASFGSGDRNGTCFRPLAAATTVDEVERHRWPSTDWFDYAEVPRQVAAARAGDPYATICNNSNIFELSWFMRGFEQALLDLALEDPVMDRIMERVTAFLLEHNRRMLEAADGGIDLMFTADDIGGQEGLLMSLDLWRRHIKPHHMAINRGIHALGSRVIYHSDGAVMEAVPELIEMGIDVLQALQFDAAGMDPAALKRLYGDRLCFEGGISVQRTLPFGTPQEVRDEVLARIRVLGAGGGYILGPSHAIQAGTPPANIAAMFDTAAAGR